jgi:hypothetical protein
MRSKFLQISPSPVVLCILIGLFGGCGKNDSAPPFLPSDTAKTVTLLTKWNCKTDSSYYVIGGVNPYYIVYHGLSTDFWDFRSDGNVYIKEGPLSDTLGYILLSDSTIIINSFGLVLNGNSGISTITTLSVHQAIIKSNTAPTSGGSFVRTVYLQR